MATIKVGEYGFNIDVYTGVDLAAYDTAVLKLADPDGNTASLTASIVDNDNSAGQADDIVRYSVASGTFDEAGMWRRWVVVSVAGGTAQQIGDAVHFLVKAEGVP